MTEDEKQSIKEQFNDIVGDGIAPILKAAGFKKRGNNFHAHAGELDWCINIQKDRWGVNDYYSTWQFTINIGVTWKDYAACLFDKACDFPLESSCPIRTRIGNFMGLSCLNLCHRILSYRFIVLIFCNNGIVDSLCNIAENIKSYLRSDIKKLTVLSDSQIGKTINRFMNKFFYLIIFYGL